jgi:hypothetical protein
MGNVGVCPQIVAMGLEGEQNLWQASKLPHINIAAPDA